MKNAHSKKYFVGYLFIWTIIITVFLLLANTKPKLFINDISLSNSVLHNTEDSNLSQFIEIHNNRNYFIFTAIWTFGVLVSFIVFMYYNKEKLIYYKLKSTLKRSDEKFKKYFEDNLAIMLLVNPVTKNISDVNRAAVKFYGYSKEHFLKMKIYDINIIPPEDIDKKMKVAIMQKSNHLSFKHKLFNNKVKDVEVYASAFLINGEKIMSIIVHDVTEQKNTERALIKSKNRFIETSKLLETLFNAVPDVISVVDNDYNIIRYNKAGYDLLNRTHDQVVGQKHYKLMGCELPHKNCATSQVYKEKKPVKIERFDEKLNGWFEVRAYPILDNNNNVFQVIEFLQDITERKQFIDELENAKEKAEESDRLKSAFLANMSHEIRTPMNAILGFTELLLPKDLSIQNKEKYVEIIQKSGNHLLDIINDIIDISKIDAEQTRLYKTNFNLNHLLFEIYQLFHSLITEKEDKEIRLVLNNGELHSQDFIFTDKKRLKQVLINLIGNAIKFTDKGSISFGYEIGTNNTILFSVKDTGIGISDQEAKFIFDRFRQVDERYKRVFGGTGLGLAISKEFVELMEGKIWVQSVKGEGSTFYFTLPCKFTDKVEPKKLSEKKNENLQNKIKGKKILIVEDDIYSMLVLEELLTPSGAELLTAKDGLQAIQLCIENKDIDLVLMDIQLPRLDGIQATQRIKKINPNLPIIAQTAHVMQSEKQKAMTKGFNDYITKPINREELFRKINRYIL